MGAKYRINYNGKVIRRKKSDWPKYINRKGKFELQVWEGAGKGWQTVQKSSGR
jgi:hypothetical protein